MMPLLALVAGVAVLALLLAALTLSQSGQEDAGIALCNLSQDEIDRISYQGNDTDFSLCKDDAGTWTMEENPTLPLDQQVVATLVENLAGLTAARQLQTTEMTDIPARSDTPLMVFSVTGAGVTHTWTVDSANDVAAIYYVYDENGTAYTVSQSNVNVLCKTPRELYKSQTLTEKTIEDVTTLQVGSLCFSQSDETWTLADDPDYPLDQDAVKKMVNTLCGAKTDWTITTPEADSVYGLDAPDVTATVTFADGSSLTVRFGDLTQEDESLCYMASSQTPEVVYEANAEYKTAFAVTKESLHEETSTEESAQTDSIVAEHPVGGKDDYADVAQEE